MTIAFSRSKKRKLLLSCVARCCNALHNSLNSLDLCIPTWLSDGHCFISNATYSDCR